MEALKGTIQVDHPSTIGTAVIKADPATIALDLTSVANDLFAYANTVRYARLRNSYTLTLEYLRLLYRVGGDQNEFATRLGLATNASILDCIKAVNKKKFGFKTNITKADSYNPDLVKKLVEHWTSVITDLATLKQNNP